MTDALRELDETIAILVADARGDDAALREIAAALIAGVGLTIAVHAGGDAETASVLCESAAGLIFDAATQQASNLRFGRSSQ